MKTVGLIVEYNPLHYGHVYHFEQSKRTSDAEAVVAVMSGHFLQRGEPAIVSKWARTEMALRMGVDLVIELPVAFSCQPAEWFAYGAVSALEQTGIVDSLCFGSEHGDLSDLLMLADLLYQEPPLFKQALAEELGHGSPYPKAYANAASRLIVESGAAPSAALLQEPNNSLGLHYLLALKKWNSKIQPLTIRREKSRYMQQDITDSKIASATAIRKLLLDEENWERCADYLPPSTLEILQREAKLGRGLMCWNHFYPSLLHLLHSMSPQSLSDFAEVTEGLEHRMKQSLTRRSFDSFHGWIQSLKTKRYTLTKLQRTMTRILLQHRKSELAREVLSRGVPYLRVLGFSSKGRELLRRMKHTAKVPVILQAGKEHASMLHMDIQAAAVYAHAFPKQADASAVYRDYYKPPIQI
ncbi:nucleotidyltransferase [Marinicrinis lubricantis]|uniref:tRNA(Met) cytidine acetate ligase n=1 Tax=Marinicrinis lubricantis TaxID=2086470 RepID=A0ABW1IMK1_9BACL